MVAIAKNLNYRFWQGPEYASNYELMTSGKIRSLEMCYLRSAVLEKLVRFLIYRRNTLQIVSPMIHWNCPNFLKQLIWATPPDIVISFNCFLSPWKVINPFFTNTSFLYPMKHQKTVRFFHVFRGQRKGTLGTNRTISISEAEECLSYWVGELGGEDILSRWVENFIEIIVSVVIPSIA